MEMPEAVVAIYLFIYLPHAFMCVIRCVNKMAFSYFDFLHSRKIVAFERENTQFANITTNITVDKQPAASSQQPFHCVMRSYLNV